MKVFYTIHKIGTPKMAWPNHWTSEVSEYWNREKGWANKKEFSIFTEEERNTLDLPEDGEWIEIYVNENASI